MKSTFENTVNILVKAYLNGTLEHGICRACAVGNIVGGSNWSIFFQTDSTTGEQMYSASKPLHCFNMVADRTIREARREIKMSGYSRKDLARIEYAFETADQGNSEDEWMFNGLMAVVDVLADIHGIYLKQKSEAKAMFIK